MIMMRIASSLLLLPLSYVIGDGVSSPPSSVTDYIKSGGIVAILVTLIYGGFREKPWWVFGWVYRDREAQLQGRIDELKIEVDEWKTIGLQGTHAAAILTEAKQIVRG